MDKKSAKKYAKEYKGFREFEALFDLLLALLNGGKDDAAR
jgi:hypothetical protein